MEPKSFVRLARLSDIDEVVKLCSEHARFEKANFSPEGKAERLSSAIFTAVPRLWCFVAESRGSIVGYATCTKDFSTWGAADFLHMDCLYLDPAHRNAGIAYVAAPVFGVNCCCVRRTTFFVFTCTL